MTQPTNAKGRKFSWSFSAWKEFDNCPLRYAHNKFYCTTPWQETEAIKWGNRVHKAAEDTIKGKPVTDTEALKPVQPYLTAFQNCGAKNVEAELEVALNRNLKPTGWFFDDAWFRAKIDVIVTLKCNKSVMLYDWKTGKSIRDEPDQLKICAAALARDRIHLENFNGKFIWTAHGETTGMDPLTREGIKNVWAEYLPKIERMEEAWRTEIFPARPSGLCPWCSVDKCVQRRGERRV
jgi:hypothetical protein